MHVPLPSFRKANPPPADTWLAAIIESSDDAIISKDLVNQAIVMTETRDELLHKVCKVLVEHGKFPLA